MFHPIRNIFIFLIFILCTFYSLTALSNEECKWVEKAEMPTARSEFSTVVHNDKVYVLGGVSKTEAIANFEVFDPKTNKWEILAPMIEPNHHGSLGVVNGKIYLIGGFVDLTWKHANGIIYQYDIKNNLWKKYDDLSRLRVAHTSETIDNKIYIFGGHGYKPSHVLYYIPEEKKMRELETRMPSPADHIASIINTNGDIIILGGRFRTGNLNMIRIYNFKENKWFANEALPLKTSGHIAEIVKDRIYVVGGENLDNDKTFKENWYYDFKKNNWYRSLDLPYGLHGMGSGVINNELYIFGGGKSAGMETFNTLQNKTLKLECNEKL